MIDGYFSQLDGAISFGLKLLPEPFCRRQADYLASGQRPDGGFAGRQGGADLYYTRFALETLHVLPLEPDPLIWQRAARYVDQAAASAAGALEAPVASAALGARVASVSLEPAPPSASLEAVPPPALSPAAAFSLVDALSLLHALHLLELHGCRPLDEVRRSALHRLMIGFLASCRAADGGFLAAPARAEDAMREHPPAGPAPAEMVWRAAPTGSVSNVYYTFLAELCYELLECSMPRLDLAVAAVLSHRTADGGFFGQVGGRPGAVVPNSVVAQQGMVNSSAAAPAAPHPGAASPIAAEPAIAATAGQTNPTAAALTFLWSAGALDETVATGAARFLEAMQSPSGGLRAHGHATAADLMSTFTGFCALGAAGVKPDLKLSHVARFVQAMQVEGGGFKASGADTVADMEYTFYGLGALGLLAGVAAL